MDNFMGAKTYDGFFALNFSLFFDLSHGNLCAE